jgi:fido (protein-threonine AMPylation protein)
MSDNSDRAATGAAQEQREGELVARRAMELFKSPLKGAFDVQHLQNIHAYLFQDTPRHHPGVVREDTGRWSKQRALEGKSGTYEVAYLADGVEARIKGILDNFGGSAALRGLSADEVAEKLARLYGDLDHAHGFYEGNSRTLREFTRSLAAEASFRLDWTGTNVTADQRNALYVARDLEVITRRYPGMTPATANTREEYEATLQAGSIRRTLGGHPLLDIIRAGLSPSTTLQAEPAAVTKGNKTEEKIADYWSNQLAKGEKAGPEVAVEQTQTKGRKR